MYKDNQDVGARTYERAWDATVEEESDRREGKGRRCCFGDELYLILCRTEEIEEMNE